jgi:uncharacterized cupredoxin-like copper-binding protein
MPPIRMLSKLGLLAGLVLLLAASFALTGERQASAQQPGIEAGVRAAMQAAVNAWNQRDVGSFVAQFTDAGLLAEFEISRNDVAEFGEFIGDPPISLLSVTNVRPTGDPATATVATAIIDLDIGGTIERAERTFRLVDGRWKIDGSRELAAPIPAGTTTVDVSLVEYGFIYDKALAGRGNIAFRTQNAGREQHELVLFRITSNRALLEIVQDESEEPEDIEFIAGAGPWAPGEQSTVVFTRVLQAGRYGLVCFIPAPDDVPHAFKGMVSEFTVGGGGTGGAISPPSTGDAGLAGASWLTREVMYALSAALIALSTAGTVLTRRS